MSDIVQEVQPQGELALDPFGFLPGVASKIAGLGGTARGQDDNYVFHTPYVEAAEGPAHFTVRFTGLAAKRGTLVLRVHMLPIEPGSYARLANSERIVLNRLIYNGGETAIAFEGFRGVSYALYGFITDETDARAAGLSVTLDRPADPNDDRRFAPEAKSTEFGRDAAQETPDLLAVEPPTLAAPVSQAATAAQLREPAAARWLDPIAREPLSPRARWRIAYTLQALRRYGMLEPDAQGLGFGAIDGPISALIAAHGVSLTLAVPPEEVAAGEDALRDRLRRPALCDTARFDQAVTIHPALLAPLPVEFVNFDFLWSTSAPDLLGSIRAGQQFMEDAMACLRPGGLAIHTLDYDFGSSQPGSETTIAQRRHLEQIALILISRGHEVAQIKVDVRGALIDPSDSDPRLVYGRGIGSFGLIARKAPSAY